MYTTLGIVEVMPPIDSLPPRSPLAGIARRHFAGRPLLEWVVRRASDAHHLEQVVVVAGNDPHSRSLASLAPGDARIVISDGRDPLARLAAVVREFPCQAVVRLSISDPFVDPILIDRLITSAAADADCDYACFCFHDRRPVPQSRVGVFAQWCRAEAVLQANRQARSPADRNDPMRFVASHEELFVTKLIPVPLPLDRDDLRLGIADEEDWENVQMILDALGPESLDWQYITALLDRNPNVCRRMAELNRAEATALV